MTITQKNLSHALRKFSERVFAGLVVNRTLRGFFLVGRIKFKSKKETFLCMHIASLQRAKDGPSLD